MSHYAPSLEKITYGQSDACAEVHGRLKNAAETASMSTWCKNKPSPIYDLNNVTLGFIPI